MTNEKLIAARENRGWTQAHLAEKLEVTPLTISRWENGSQVPRAFMLARLRRIFDMSAEQLGFSRRGHAKQTHMLPVHPHLDQFVTRNEEMKIKRRELLYLFGLAGSAMILPDLDWQRIEGAIVHPSRLDKGVVGDLELITRSCWNLYLAAPSKSSVLNGVLGHLKTLLQFLRDSHPTSVHQQLCALSSSMSQLAGEIFFDGHEYDTAQSCYAFAADAAKEAKAYDLWSCAMVRHSFIPLYDDRPRYEDALPLLQGARRLASRGDSSLPTRYWVAAVEAEALSGIGNLAACQEALDQAQDVLDIKTVSPAWVRFDSSRLPALRGASFVRLEQPDLAEPALQEALQRYVIPGRKRGMVLSDLALAALQRGEVDQACDRLDEMLDIVALGSSGFLRESVRKLQRQLEPFAESGTVKRLDQRLTGLETIRLKEEK